MGCLIENEDYYKVYVNMQKHGDKFIKYLGLTIQYSNPKNRKIIKNAFPKLWDMYAKGLYKQVSYFNSNG